MAHRSRNPGAGPPGLDYKSRMMNALYAVIIITIGFLWRWQTKRDREQPRGKGPEKEVGKWIK